MDQTFPKEEKLKSRAAIDLLFRNGRSVAVFPLRLVYRKSDVTHPTVKFSVSVSKKYFKKAVERNYIKRILRESYRFNKSALAPASDFDFMLIYQAKEIESFPSIREKTALVFEKFIKREIGCPE